MKHLFIHPTENRLRTGWRLLAFVILFWTFSASIFLIKPLLGDISKSELITDYRLVVIALLTVSATLSVWICRKFIDKKSISSLGINWKRISFRDLGFGFILSGLMAGAFFLILWAFGLIEYNGLNIGQADALPSEGFAWGEFLRVFSWGALLVFLVEHILVAYWEELVFRGYLFQNMREGMGLVLAIAVSCIIFGMIHFTNPNAGWLSTVIIMIFGLKAIYGYLSSKMLWLPIGMHIGWNFFQGPIFGFSASGNETAHLMNISITGPEWLSGGEFGPEASLIILPVLALAFLAIRWWTGRGKEAEIAGRENEVSFRKVEAA